MVGKRPYSQTGELQVLFPLILVGVSLPALHCFLINRCWAALCWKLKSNPEYLNSSLCAALALPALCSVLSGRLALPTLWALPAKSACPAGWAMSPHCLRLQLLSVESALAVLRVPWFLFCLSEITVFYCQMSSVLKTLFHIFSLLFSPFGLKGKSGPYYSILARELRLLRKDTFK